MPKGGSHKGKKSRSVDDDIKEEVKEGIVEMFAGTKRRQSFMDEAPTGGIFITPFNWYFIMYAHCSLWPDQSAFPAIPFVTKGFCFSLTRFYFSPVCPVCRLPMHLLSGESMVTPRVHIENCKVDEKYWHRLTIWNWTNMRIKLSFSRQCFLRLRSLMKSRILCRGIFAQISRTVEAWNVFTSICSSKLADFWEEGAWSPWNSGLGRIREYLTESVNHSLTWRTNFMTLYYYPRF